MTETMQRMEAERQLMNLQALRNAQDAHRAHLQHLKLLPSVVSFYDYNAPEREALKKKTEWTCFPDLKN